MTINEKLAEAQTRIAELQAQLDEARNLLQSAINLETGSYANWIQNLRTVLDDPDATPPKNPADGKWCISGDGEHFDEAYDTRAEAVRNTVGGDYIGRSRFHPISRYVPDATDVLYMCSERACDKVKDGKFVKAEP